MTHGIKKRSAEKHCFSAPFCNQVPAEKGASNELFPCLMKLSSICKTIDTSGNDRSRSWHFPLAPCCYFRINLLSDSGRLSLMYRSAVMCRSYFSLSAATVAIMGEA